MMALCDAIYLSVRGVLIGFYSLLLSPVNIFTNQINLNKKIFIHSKGQGAMAICAKKIKFNLVQKKCCRLAVYIGITILL